MNQCSQKEKAEVLLSLNKREDLRVLPNIYDPINARILVAKRLLNDASFQQDLAEAIFNGIKKFKEKYEWGI